MWIRALVLQADRLFVQRRSWRKRWYMTLYYKMTQTNSQTNKQVERYEMICVYFGETIPGNNLLEEGK